MDKIIIQFSPEEVQRILRISLDDDEEDALDFIKNCLEKKIKEKTRPHCVPVFEESYSPKQKDRFKG